MPKNNSPEARERRRAAAEARAGVAEAVTKAGMTLEELRVFNANIAAAKASHEEGGGHFHATPEMDRGEGLVAAKHVSKWIKSRGRFTLRADGRTCPIFNCASCLAESDEAQIAELNHKIFSAQAGLRMKREAETKRLGLAPMKHGRKERPDVGFALQDR